MMDTDFLGAWLAYVVITFAMGFLWHLVLFKGLYARLAIFTRLDDPIVPLGFVAILIQGAILAFLYPRLAGGGPAVVEGLRFGLLLALLMISTAVLAEAAKQRVTALGTWIAVESAYYAIQFSLSGIAIALVYA